MGYTINVTLPANGFDGIRVGEIYERSLFSNADLKALLKIWRIRPGTIQDRAHKGVEVVNFIARRQEVK